MPFRRSPREVSSKTGTAISAQRCEILLTLEACARIRVAAGRTAFYSLGLPGQQTTERRKEIFMAKKAKKADKKVPKKAK